ncbi:hypothetical protein BHE74_00036268 [Ensete ventricosum]|nr:hypothetical protein BHE74_00036268 [Ensete ventricosum]RZS27254.1 hypothetical protein BHM03_00060695 [Ensete ventricosum]
MAPLSRPTGAAAWRLRLCRVAPRHSLPEAVLPLLHSCVGGGVGRRLYQKRPSPLTGDNRLSQRRACRLHRPFQGSSRPVVSWLTTCRPAASWLAEASLHQFAVCKLAAISRTIPATRFFTQCLYVAFAAVL